MDLQEALNYFGIAEVPTLKELNILFLKKKATLESDEEIEQCMEAFDVLQDVKSVQSVTKSIIVNGKNIQLQSLRQGVLSMDNSYPNYLISGLLVKAKGNPVDVIQYAQTNQDVSAIVAPHGLKKGDVVLAQTLDGPRRITIERCVNA